MGMIATTTTTTTPPPPPPTTRSTTMEEKQKTPTKLIHDQHQRKARFRYIDPFDLKKTNKF